MMMMMMLEIRSTVDGELMRSPFTSRERESEGKVDIMVDGSGEAVSVEDDGGGRRGARCRAQKAGREGRLARGCVSR